MDPVLIELKIFWAQLRDVAVRAITHEHGNVDQRPFEFDRLIIVSRRSAATLLLGGPRRRSRVGWVCPRRVCRASENRRCTARVATRLPGARISRVGFPP